MITSTTQISVLTEIQHGIPLVPKPYEDIAVRLGLTESEVLDAIHEINSQGILKRYGIVVRHRELGFRANGMVVWDVPEDIVDQIGNRLGSEDAVTLCYCRRRDKDHWPYNLYCMIHGKTKEYVLGQISALNARHKLNGFPSKTLFSSHRLKQCGGQYV